MHPIPLSVDQQMVGWLSQVGCRLDLSTETSIKPQSHGEPTIGKRTLLKGSVCTRSVAAQNQCCCTDSPKDNRRSCESPWKPVKSVLESLREFQ
eukprot:2671451-Amphidinium_carterae.1